MIIILTMLLLATGCGNPEDSAKSNNPSDASGVEWVAIHTAIQNAEDDGKKILIDVYTEWCGYCRKMNTETYTDPEVQEALNKYFHPVRLNAESKNFIEFEGEAFTEQDFALALGVRGYPTTVILDRDGSAVGKQPGFMEAEDFKNLLTYVGSDAFKTTPFDEYMARENGE